jgi:hypothetical protein
VLLTPACRTDSIVSLLRLSLNFVHSVSEEALGSSSVCPFTVLLISIPPSLRPEFVVYNVLPAAAIAAATAADELMLVCSQDVSISGDSSPTFVCATNHHHSPLVHKEPQILRGTALAEAAAHATGLKLEASDTAALFLLHLGEDGFRQLDLLQLNLWLVNGQYTTAVQQLLLLITSTHYLLHDAPATNLNSFMTCSASTPCLHLVYIHKRFVVPAPTYYSPSSLPFSRTNYSTDIDAAGGHYFSTLVLRQKPWRRFIPALSADDEPSASMRQWREREGQWRESKPHTDHRLRYIDEHDDTAADNTRLSLKTKHMDLDVMPLEEHLVLDRCNFDAFSSIFASSPPIQTSLRLLIACRCNDGCDAASWSLTVVLGLHKRPANFLRVFRAVVEGSASVSRIIFTLNGSPHVEEFRSLIAEARLHPAITERGIRLDVAESSVEVGFYFRCCRKSVKHCFIHIARR